MGAKHDRSEFRIGANSNPAARLAMRDSRSCGEPLEQTCQVNARSGFNGAQ